MSVLEELRQDRPSPKGGLFQSWLNTQSAPDRAEWIEAMHDASISVPAILRAAKKRGYSGQQGSVRTFRINLIS